jgi:hypothetical protein
LNIQFTRDGIVLAIIRRMNQANTKLKVANWTVKSGVILTAVAYSTLLTIQSVPGTFNSTFTMIAALPLAFIAIGLLLGTTASYRRIGSWMKRVALVGMILFINWTLPSTTTILVFSACAALFVYVSIMRDSAEVGHAICPFSNKRQASSRI